MQAPNIDPVIFQLGPLQVRWYGLMYVIGFILLGFILKKFVREKFFKVSEEKVDSYITMGIILMFLGARFAYVFIYNWEYFSNHLGEILSVWRGGLSFHGAIVGLIVSMIIFARRNKIHFFEISDSLVIAGTQGMFFGRIGNFINGELCGRVTEMPWGMVFKGWGPYPRHPSQLYEAFAEGILLFLILFLMRKRVRLYGIISSLFLILYGTFRYFIEFFREADVQLGYYFGGTTTMGQILCFLMVLSGIGLMVYACKNGLKITAYHSSKE